MTDLQRTGRLIGVLTLLQMIGGGVTNFVLLAPLFAAPGFLANAAAHPLRVGAAVLVGLAAGAVSAGIAILAATVFRRYNRTIALCLAVLAAVVFTMSAIEAAANLSFLYASQGYAAAEAADRHLYETLRPMFSSIRDATHYLTVFVGGCMHFVLYGALFRFALIPRALAGFGLAATLLQLTAIAMPIFGEPIVFTLLLPIALSQLALALWLLAKGFVERAAATTPVMADAGAPV
jgi:hypothetical protein